MLSNHNGLTMLRVAAALTVIYAHAFPLLHIPAPAHAFGPGLGSLAVNTFFSISGYLIAASWANDPHILRFLIRRFLRIFPALLTVLVILSMLVGPLITSERQSYFSGEAPYRYITLALADSKSATLPGVFSANIYPNVVNGSLWTIRYELLMYMLFALISMAIPSARKHVLYPALFVGLGMAWIIVSDRFGTTLRLFESVDFVADRIAYLGAFFFAGTSYYAWRESIHLKPAYAVVLCALTFLAPTHSMTMVLSWMAVPYSALTFAEYAPDMFKGWRHDYSYGIYIYAFPAQQIASQYSQLIGLENWGLVIACLVITIPMAAFSWHLIERPALAMKLRVTVNST